MFAKTAAVLALSAALLAGGTTAASASPGDSGSAYAGEVTFDHGKFCLGAKAQANQGKPVNSTVWWVPCAFGGFYKKWVIVVVHRKTGSIAQFAIAANLEVCMSEVRTVEVALRPCEGADNTWANVRELSGGKAWTAELDGRWLAGPLPLPANKAVNANWSKKTAFLFQFPPHAAHTA